MRTIHSKENTMKKTLLFSLSLLSAVAIFSQSTYSSTGGIETLYKGKYTFTVKLDEKTNTLSFETNAPVSVVTLETYTPEELAVRKGKEYTDMYYIKVGNKYSYNLKQPLLKDQYSYWLKVSTGNNGAPLAEYFFRKKTSATSTSPTEGNTGAGSGEEVKNAAGATVIKTNIKCAAGKTKVINALKELEGVTEVKIDIVSGKLTIMYSSDGTTYSTILFTINDNGFDTNTQKTSNISANPCKTKAIN